VVETIDDNDKALKHCVKDIILILNNIETMTDANEATRCEFIASILHASVAIARRTTKEKIFISLQKDISGEEVSGRVDYSIKGRDELMCIAEGKPRNIKIGYLQVRSIWTVSLMLLSHTNNILLEYHATRRGIPNKQKKADSRTSVQ